MDKILSIESPIFQWLSKLADRMILNVLFVISSLPIVTIGAATTALYNVTMRIERDEGHVWKDYWKAFRSNFKQATILWLILLMSGALLGFSALFYLQSDITGSVLGFLLVVVLFLLWAITSAWVFPLQSRFENTIQQTLKNALICGILCLLRSIVVVIINLLPVIIFFLSPETFLYLAIIWLIVWFSVTASINMSIFKKQFAELEKLSIRET